MTSVVISFFLLSLGLVIIWRNNRRMVITSPYDADGMYYKKHLVHSDYV